MAHGALYLIASVKDRHHPQYHMAEKLEVLAGYSAQQKADNMFQNDGFGVLKWLQI